MATRITHNVKRGEQITVTINGTPVTAYAGETVAAILLANDINLFYKTDNGKARGPYCNMGTCFECRVTITTENSKSWQRACMTTAEHGMSISTAAAKSTL